MPLTRDYVAAREARLRERESQKPALRLAGKSQPLEAFGPKT